VSSQARRLRGGGGAAATGRRRQALRWAAFRLACLALLGPAGCASFIDDVTSRDFEFRELFFKPNPFVVLRDSKDGDKRAKALRALHEPLQNGGTKEEQDEVVRILCTAAVSEHHVVARAAAIQALGRFKDPRAAEGLKAAYFSAGGYQVRDGSRLESVAFPPDQVTLLRCQALTSMGEVRNPAVIEHLITVLRQPPSRGSVQERQMVMDERIAAARSLGNYNYPEATAALVDILKREKDKVNPERDVALHDQVHDSLVAATGKKLPADAQAWETALREEGGKNRGEAVAAKEQGGIYQLLNFFQFGKDASKPPAPAPPAGQAPPAATNVWGAPPPPPATPGGQPPSATGGAWNTLPPSAPAAPAGR